MAYPSGMPQDQQDILTQLSGSGGLEGINPAVLAEIDQWESDFETAGAGVNSSGYGGYFGLGTAPYPGGTLTTADLNTSSDAEFTKQAHIAASEVNSLLQQNNGDLQAAMNAYDGGSSAETAGVIAAAGGNPGGEPGDIQGGSGAAVQTANSVAARTPLGGSGNLIQELDALLNPSGGGFVEQLTTLGASDAVATAKLLVFRGLFAGIFVAITLLGIKALTAAGTGGGSKGPSVTDFIDNERNRNTRQNAIDVQSQNASTAAAAESRKAGGALAGSGTGAITSGAAGEAGEATAGIVGEAADAAILLL